jgi:hypothetical protein
VKKSFNIKKLLHLKSVHAPLLLLLLKTIPRTPKTQSKAFQFGGSDNYKIKNKTKKYPKKSTPLRQLPYTELSLN